jgi:hypothetical protein
MSHQQVHLPASRFSPPGLGGVPFPGFINTIRTLRLPAAHLAALRFLRLAIPYGTSCGSLPPVQDVKTGEPGGIRMRHPHDRALRWRRPDLPSSWGTPIVGLPRSQTPAGRWLLDPCKSTAWPPLLKRQRLPQGNFRSSIAWLSDSLSTLRWKSHPFTAQDSLPGAGQALLDGLDYPQGSDERFQR